MLFRIFSVRPFIRSHVAASKTRSAVLTAPDATLIDNLDSKGLRRNEEALFHCSKIVLGRLLGEGAFCDVHDLYDVSLLNNDELEQQKITNNIERQKREFIHGSCRDE